MAFLPPLPILVIAGFFLGLSWGPFNPLVSTLIQQRVPADQQGRVFGVQTAVFYAAPPLGMVAAGLSVESFGVSSHSFPLSQKSVAKELLHRVLIASDTSHQQLHKQFRMRLAIT
jgi:MFS family permease